MRHVAFADGLVVDEEGDLALCAGLCSAASNCIRTVTSPVGSGVLGVSL